MNPYEPPTEDGPDPDRLRDEAWDRKHLGAAVCEVHGIVRCTICHPPRDEMDEAHKRDVQYERLLREARMALRAVLDENRLGKHGEAELNVAARRLSSEMDHIVARWN